MLTREHLKNLERNFTAHAKKILTAQAYDPWHPIILELIQQAYGGVPTAKEDKK